MTRTPSPAISGLTPYKVPRHGAPMDLLLDGIGGLPTRDDVFQPLLDADAEALVRHYPDTSALTALLAEKHGVGLDQVLVTCGGDDALDRGIRSTLSPGRNMVLPVPTFEMLARYATWTGGEMREVAWDDGPWPIEAVLAAADANTTVVPVVSPNNPTGAVCAPDTLRALSAALPDAVLLVDLAYVEFADVDLMPVALSLPNAVAFRTLSKAYGMAGLRVGYAVGPADVIGWMKAAGNPYTVTGPSACLAHAWLSDEAAAARSAAFIAAVRDQRSHLKALLAVLGATPQDSQANYVFARTPHADWLRDGMAGLGIGVRTWPGHPTLGDATRINVPGDDAVLARLEASLRSVLAPEAILLDMDGVITEVSGSYREAIVQTAATFGVPVGKGDIEAIKAKGDANNDWIVTQRLMQARGVEVPYDQIVARFEALYHGTAEAPGLKATERLLLPVDMLAAWAARYPIAIVTGRPHDDAVEFLDLHGLTPHVSAIVAMEDGPAKPDPAPVQLALERLGVANGWMVGDTVDDVVAARAAGVVPIGVVVPGGDADRAHAVLTGAGAARVLPDVTHLQELLP